MFEDFLNNDAVPYDRKEREQIVDYILNSLQNGGSASVPTVPKTPADVQLSALREILNDETLLKECADDRDLRGNIQQELLNYLSLRTVNPKFFEDEAKYVQGFRSLTSETFEKSWGKYKKIIQERYGSDQIDTGFYEKELKVQFEATKEHLAERWECLLAEKQLAEELKLIEELRKKFAYELYKKLKEYLELKTLLSPFLGHLGRFWDLTYSKLSKQSAENIKKYAELLKNSKNLQSLADELGKSRQAEKELEYENYRETIYDTVWRSSNSAKSEISGVTIGNNLNAVLPSEIALLSFPETEMIFCKKFAENKLQIFEYRTQVREEYEAMRTKEKENPKGPYIICVDTSGSMHGAPENIAKAIALMVLKLSVSEKRLAYLITFSTAVKTFELSNLQQSLPDLINFLTQSFHGGTDFYPALNAALEMALTDEYQLADILLISDFVVPELNENLQKKISEIKDNENRIISIAITNENSAAIDNNFDIAYVFNPNSMDIYKKTLLELKGGSL
ncbi:MAG: VWA domain-containing protein [Deferribacteraceae bacterium]|jgi:uncharacterized protein with von Willebrand factor type A (vWA) domain|nr:VWA domain-containing protein [Deferribacteraceae bacterium]